MKDSINKIFLYPVSTLLIIAITYIFFDYSYRIYYSARARSKAIFFLSQNQAERALEILKKAKNYRPNWGELDYYIGKSYLMLKNYSQAIKYFNKALRNFEDYNLHLLLAIAYHKSGNYKKALEHYNRGLAYNFRFPELKKNKALLLYDLVVQQLSKQPDLISNLWTNLLNKYLFNKKINIYPSIYKDLNHLISLLNQAIDLWDKDPRFFITKAILELFMEQFSFSIENFSKAILLQPNDFNSYLWLSRLFIVKKDFLNAIKFHFITRSLIDCESKSLIEELNTDFKLIMNFLKDSNTYNINLNSDIIETYCNKNIFFEELINYPQKVIFLNPIKINTKLR